MMSSTKPEVHIMLSDEDRATATGNMHRKFSEAWTCCLWDTRADRQTEIQAHRNTPHP